MNMIPPVRATEQGPAHSEICSLRRIVVYSGLANECPGLTLAGQLGPERVIVPSFALVTLYR